MEINDLDTFLDYWRKVRGRTERVLALVPADELEWRLADGRFSFGDLARHLGAIERWMFAENVKGRQSRYPGHGRGLADGVDEVWAFMARMHAEALEIFASLTREELEARCETPGGVRLRTWKWLRSMVEHEAHHRGQIYMMLGVLGVSTPPMYGLTSEEVKARSL
ncbi:MAG: DinB family protein [Gemmatimonadota bacterium]